MALNKFVFQNMDINLHFESVAENVPHIFSFIHPEDFTILYINRVEPGYVKEEVIGKSIFNYLLPEQQPLYEQKINEVIRSGQKQILNTGFHSYQDPNGVSWFQTTISPVFNPEKELESILILSEDISDSKNLELENHHRSERLKAIINNNDDMICSIDVNYNLIEFNSVLEKIVLNSYGVKLKAGVPILDYIAPDRHEHLISIYKRVLEGEICHDIESYDTSSKGKMFLETSFHPIYGLKDQITGISIFSKDITQRVKNEQKIKDALKEKEALLSEIHHRIKNNLAMISSMLQLQELTMLNKESQEALSSSRKRIKTTALIHEMLYRNETFNEISLKEFITELYELLKTNNNFILFTSGEDIKFNLSTALPLGLMLNELMLNSFKHSFDGLDQGKTEIAINTDNGKLNIEYCDCKGVFPQEVDFSNSNTTGLTLIHTFADQLEGKIELISNQPPKYLIQIPLDENHQ